MRTKIAFVAVLGSIAMLASVVHAQRGTDGQLSIIYWQAVSILNPYLSAGTKDVEAASLVLEPLAYYDEDGNMVPVLAEAIPRVAADLKSITWKLKRGIVWSDGSPLTADDVVFTFDYCLHPEGGCQQSQFFTDAKSVTKVDDLTVLISFTVAKPFPYGPFVGAGVPILQKAQFQGCMGARAPECTAQNFGPIGTGPFIVTDFRANDVVTYAANPKYREPDKPHFATVVLKGGGDAASAARSVLETGEFDYAWNLQIEPEVITQMEAAGKGRGTAVYDIDVPEAGHYMLSARVHWLDGCSNSIGFTVDNDHLMLTSDLFTQWHEVAARRTVRLEAGRTRVIIRNVEDGVRVDYWVLRRKE